MALAGYGKIDESDGLRQAFQQILAAQQYEYGLVRITGRTAGLITLRNGQYISGAVVKSTGQTDIDALKVLLGLSEGLYSYMSAEKLPDDVKIDQPLKVDIAALLNSGEVPLDTALERLFQQAQSGLQSGQMQSAQPAVRPVYVHDQGRLAAPAVPNQPPIPNQPLIPDQPPIPNQPPQPAAQSAAPIWEATPVDSWSIDLPSTRRTNTTPAAEQIPPQQIQQPQQWQNQPAMPAPTSRTATAPAPAAGIPNQDNAPASTPFGLAAPPMPPPPQNTGAAQAAAFNQANQNSRQSNSGPILPQAEDLQKFKQSQELHNFRQAQQQFSSPTTQAAPPQNIQPGWPTPSAAMPVLPATQEISAQSAAATASADDLTPQRTSTFRRTTSESLEKTKRTEELLLSAQRLRTTEISTAGASEQQQKFSLSSLLDRGTITGISVVVVVAGLVIFYFCSSNPQAGIATLVDQGKQQLSLEKYDAARVQLTLALEKKPNDPEILELRAQAYEGAGNLEQALADYDQLLKLQPNNTSLLLKAAIAQYRTDHLPAAIAACDKILQAESKNDSAMAVKTMALARSGAVKEAIELSNKIGQSNTLPKDLASAYDADLGFAYLKSNQAAQAIPCYTKALSASPDDWRNLIERAQCYIQTGKAKDALTDLTKAKDLRKTDPLAFKLMGDCYASLHDDTAAAKAYTDAAQFTPRPADLYLKIAHCYFNTQKYGDTERACELALTIQPNNKAAAELKDMATAKAKSAKPLLIGDRTVFYEKEKPADPTMGMGMGMFPQQLPMGAQSMYSGTVRGNSSGGQDPLVAAGYNALQQKDIEKASRLLARAVEKDSSNYFARSLLGQALLKRNDARHAYEQFDIAGQHGMLTPADQISFGQAAMQIGRPDKAAEIYSHCLLADPNSVEARVSLIKAYVTIGDTARANDLAQTGAKLRPQDAETFHRALGAADKR